MSNEGKVDAPAVPQGWKLVPIEPTKEMLDAGLKRKAQARWLDGALVLRARTENLRPAEEIAALQWEAMLAATPAPAPAQEVGLTDEEIEAIAKKHMSTVGDHWCNEEAIRERHAEDFARAIIAALREKGGK